MSVIRHRTWWQDSGQWSLVLTPEPPTKSVPVPPASIRCVRCTVLLHSPLTRAACCVQTQVGGKGTVRRKHKAAHKTSGGDDKKLSSKPLTLLIYFFPQSKPQRRSFCS